MLTTLGPRALTARPAAAVTWINGRHATLARTTPGGAVETVEIERGTEAEEAFLFRVVQEIGDRDRVMILGPSSTRLALEREYVSIVRRPDRLVDVEPSGPIATGDLVARLRVLAA
jgi:hypothetical protein